MQTTFVCLIKYSHYQFCLIWFISHTSPGTQPIRLTNLRYHLSYQPTVVSHGTLPTHTLLTKIFAGEDASWPTKLTLPPWSWGLLPLRETRKSQAHARYASWAPLQRFFFNLRSFSAATSPLWWHGIHVLHRHATSCSPRLHVARPAPLFSRSPVITGGNTSVPITQRNNV